MQSNRNFPWGLPSFLMPKLPRPKFIAIFLSLSLLLWLVKNGIFTWTQFVISWEYPFLIFIVFIAHLLFTFFAVLRWQLLFARNNLPPVSFVQVYKIHHLSQGLGLFSVANIGTDLVRWHHFANIHQHAEQKILHLIIKDRLVSLFAIVFIMFLLALVYLNLIPFIFALSLLSVFLCIHFRYLTLFLLAVIPHIVRLITFSFLLSSLTNQMISLQKLLQIIGLILAEALPISFEGFGILHFAAEKYWNASGILAINIFLIGKIIFKLSGLIFWRLVSNQRN